MPSLHLTVRGSARVITASEIAALRALRHKIVEPPDAHRCHPPDPSTNHEICHEIRERFAEAVHP
jgi:hypothetical protein